MTETRFQRCLKSRNRLFCRGLETRFDDFIRGHKPRRRWSQRQIIASIDPRNWGVGETVFDSRTREPVMLDDLENRDGPNSHWTGRSWRWRSSLILAAPAATLARAIGRKRLGRQSGCAEEPRLHAQRRKEGIAGQRAGGDLSRRSGEWQVGPACHCGDHRLGVDRSGRPAWSWRVPSSRTRSGPIPANRSTTRCGPSLRSPIRATSTAPWTT